MNDEARRQAGSERNVNGTDPSTRAWSRQLEGAHVLGSVNDGRDVLAALRDLGLLGRGQRL